VRAALRSYPSAMPWSDDARVMAHPFRTYAELGAAPDPRPARALAVRVALVLLVLGGFVSLISAGRLVAFHVASTMIVWSFVPAWQAIVLALVLRAVDPVRDGGSTPKPPRPRAALVPALSLYFHGHGPWLLFLLAVAGVCLFAPDSGAAMRWLLGNGVLPAAMLGTIVWSMVLTFACFRSGLGFSRARAGAGTALFYAGFTVAIVGYYLSMNQIQPQVPWAP
jgi:hypothetical protein